MSQISHRQRLRDAGQLRGETETDLSFQPGAVERVTLAQQAEQATRHLRPAPQTAPLPFIEEEAVAIARTPPVVDPLAVQPLVPPVVEEATAESEDTNVPAAAPAPVPPDEEPTAPPENP